MSEFNIELSGGSSIRLPTAGKYCDRDIIVTAIGDGSGSNDLTNSIIERTITEFNNNTIQTIGSYAFSYCDALTKVIISSAITIGDYAFRRCTNLIEINIPLATTIGIEAFYDDNKIQSISFPKANKTGTNAFSNCRSLSEVDMPLLATIGANSFASCGNLTTLDFPTAFSIGATAFYNCTKLNKLVLRNSEVCTLSNISAFSKSPFYSDGTGGVVYVPQALISDYQNATNWSTLYTAGTCIFAAIEGSEYV